MPSLKDMKDRGLTKDQIVDYRLRSRYGITLKQKHDMFDEQKGCCAVCGEHATELKSPLCVDHCHNTGQIRGLLCYGCNTGLSYYEKHKEAYEKYLSKYMIDS